MSSIGNPLTLHTSVKNCRCNPTWVGIDLYPVWLPNWRSLAVFQGNFVDIVIVICYRDDNVQAYFYKLVQIFIYSCRHPDFFKALSLGIIWTIWQTPFICHAHCLNCTFFISISLKVICRPRHIHLQYHFLSSYYADLLPGYVFRSDAFFINLMSI